MCMYDDSGCSTAFYSAVMRKARKTHKCEECGRIISRGETYQHVSAKWEGDVSTVKTCGHCVVAQAWLQKECGGFLHHAVIDDLAEHVTEYGVTHHGFGLARLAVLARNGWRRRGELVPIPSVPRTTHEKDPQP